MTCNNKLRDRTAILALTLFAGPCLSDPAAELGGHIKARGIAEAFPHDSVFDQLTGSSALDVEADLRFNLAARFRPWSFNASYQFFALHGERVDYSRQQADPVFRRFPDDDRRLFDLTQVIEDDERSAALHRLDRFWFGYSGEKTVVRFGRQAISFGNGLFFSPMDIVNPFDPTAIDTEYKSGDDMIYTQFLRDNGDDLQAAAVFRRNPATGKVEADDSTLAIKYHGIAGTAEYDLFAALNHDDLTIGIGGNRNIGGAVIRADLVVADTADDTAAQVVANLSYSWILNGKNVSGALEYYFNGFGQPDGAYDLQSLAANTALLDRLSRGELYAIGRHYLAGSLMIEMTPLWLLTPTLFLNADDGSAFLQLVTQNNLHEDLQFLGSLNVPIGPSGTEFGGIGSAMAGRYFSRHFSVFAQLAWYF